MGRGGEGGGRGEGGLLSADSFWTSSLYNEKTRIQKSRLNQVKSVK